MLGALIIVFREVVEAGIVIGIVLAATRGIAGRGGWVALGILAGVLGASVVALFAGAISNAFAGSGQELLRADAVDRDLHLDGPRRISRRAGKRADCASPNPVACGDFH